MGTGFKLFVGPIGPNCVNHPSDVRAVQSLLQKLGLYTGDVHGYCDMATTYAIRRYQSGFMHQPNGRIENDSETWKRLSQGVPYHPFGSYDPYFVRQVPYETSDEEKSENPVITEVFLDKIFLGRSMEEICPIKYTVGNKCAHFVAHVLNIRVGMLCGGRSFEKSIKNPPHLASVSVRVNEIYDSLTRRGALSAEITPENGIMVFVCPTSYIQKNGTMLNADKKHIGIYCGGKVYNYSNRGGKVVADTSLESFLKKFQKEYNHSAQQPVSLFYGFL